MQELDDSELNLMVAQEGIMLDLLLLNNVSPTTNAPIDCTGNLNPCRMGLEFAGLDGYWLMLKENYGAIKLFDMRLDSAWLPDAATIYLDQDRFKDPSGGACLVATVGGQCRPSARPALQVSYPMNKGPGVYGDMEMFFNIGRISLEYDDPVTGTPGYMRDQMTGSVMGYRISDVGSTTSPSFTNDASMQIRFDGRAYVYGY